MARRRKIDINAEALDLLSLTMQGAKERYRDAKRNDYMIDAATISASVSLLKLVEAFKSATKDDQAAELERLRAEFAASKPSPQRAEHKPKEPADLGGELNRLYNLTGPV
ncbi:conserved protein of unknown function [Ectopseudomonas oleovorans]|uniref:Uncharacterized protein n=1 Tax=Ectopseudomonas oleovorans TaxID=301 RepID=A0A653BAE5_ECTOL|nr:conserved protein of unknown function [Pseudomonas oleovorans]